MPTTNGQSKHSGSKCVQLFFNLEGRKDLKKAKLQAAWQGFDARYDHGFYFYVMANRCGSKPTSNPKSIGPFFGWKAIRREPHHSPPPSVKVQLWFIRPHVSTSRNSYVLPQKLLPAENSQTNTTQLLICCSVKQCSKNLRPRAQVQTDRQARHELGD